MGAEYPKPIQTPTLIQELADGVGGTITECAALPDGSGFAVMSMPLPATHWIYVAGFNVPPMPRRMGTDDPGRSIYADQLRAAGRYAIRAATMNGKEMDFDPDALLQNLVVGMLGYWTPDGLSSDDWANPSMGKPSTLDAVDPVDGSGTEGPTRVKESSSPFRVPEPEKTPTRGLRGGQSGDSGAETVR